MQSLVGCFDVCACVQDNIYINYVVNVSLGETRVAPLCGEGCLHDNVHA